MHFILASLARLLAIYYRIRPILTAIFFSLLLGVGVLPITIGAQTTTFTLQIASCDARLEAERVVAQLQQHGIPSTVSGTEVPGHGEVFRVRAGNFATVTAARARGEQWRAANWISSYWIAKTDQTPRLAKAAATADESTRKRVVAPAKKLPEMGLGELLSALANKWSVRVPENLRLYSATIVFPKIGVMRPAVVLLGAAQLRALTTPNLHRRELAHPLELRFEPGIKNSPAGDGLRFVEAEWLATSLRSISGLQDLTFDERGILVLGNKIAGGSELARVLLRAALESNEAFEVESQEGSELVVFGAFMNVRLTNAEKKLTKVSKIQLDFHDFAELRGDPRLLEAFDPGFVFLHELAHGVWDLPDDERGGIGECETYINQIRRQLGLPERLSYFYKVRRQLGGIELGEMMFIQPTGGTRRRQALKLQWNNRAVNSYIKLPINDPVPLSPNPQPK